MGIFTRVIAAATVAMAAWPAAAVDIQERASPGGIPFWLVEEPSIPIVALEISFPGGSRLDAEGQQGVTNLMTGLLEEGAGDLDATAFAIARDDVSARFGFSSGRDSVEVSARMLADQLEPSSALLALALSEPRFDENAIARVRGQVLSQIAEKETNPSTQARETWFARAFPDHPYGRPREGSAETVTAITRDDLAAAHGRVLRRTGVHVAVVGAIDAEGAGALVDRVLGALPEGATPDAEFEQIAPPPGVFVQELDVPQSVAIFGQQGLKRDDPDFIPAFVMNHILGGGGFSSRLITEVREKRGLAYSTYAYLSPLDEAAVYLGGVSTANARISESLEVIQGEWRRMAEDGVSEEELGKAKRYLTGAFPLRFDSNAKIARYLVFMQEEGLGSNYLEIRNGLIEAVTVEDIERVAGRLMDPDALSIVVVGKPAGL
ncbi:MAG: pitrilysin family protein [Pseudomonadota bacterium]